MENEWKSIVNYDGLYEVSANGEIKSVARILKDSKGNTRVWPERIMKQTKDKDGYFRVCLSKDGKCTGKRVHRIVAEAFIDNPEKLPFINHKDENKTNNNYKNLEWCNAKYNSNYGNAIEKRVKSRRIPILAIKNNKILYFDSITDACRKLNLNHANVIGCLKNHYGRKTVKGWVFEYAEKI